MFDIRISILLTMIKENISASLARQVGSFCSPSLAPPELDTDLVPPDFCAKWTWHHTAALT